MLLAKNRLAESSDLSFLLFLLPMQGLRSVSDACRYKRGAEGGKGFFDFAAFCGDEVEELFRRFGGGFGFGVGVDGFEIVDGVLDALGFCP